MEEVDVAYPIPRGVDRPMISSFEFSLWNRASKTYQVIVIAGPEHRGSLDINPPDAHHPD